ncbi:MAG TPA: dihydroneopterin aldolase [Bacteroidales bacterium]|nr:dihydroneopterin aldolase [Bacteroidales bacterium]
MSKAWFELEKMEFFAFHGCFSEERVIGNRYHVWLSYMTDISKAASTDNIYDTVNYIDIYKTIQQEMAITSHLIEHVANRIANCLFEKFNAIDAVKLKLQKLNPSMGGHMHAVSITIEKSRVDKK